MESIRRNANTKSISLSKTIGFVSFTGFDKLYTSFLLAVSRSAVKGGRVSQTTGGFYAWRVPAEQEKHMT